MGCRGKFKGVREWKWTKSYRMSCRDDICRLEDVVVFVFVFSCSRSSKGKSDVNMNVETAQFDDGLNRSVSAAIRGLS